MRKGQSVWKSRPLYLSVYNILKTLTILQGGGKEIYFTVEEILEAIKSDMSYKNTDVSLRDVVKAVMILELNGLVKTMNNGEDVSRLSVALIQNER